MANYNDKAALAKSTADKAAALKLAADAAVAKADKTKTPADRATADKAVSDSNAANAEAQKAATAVQDESTEGKVALVVLKQFTYSYPVSVRNNAGVDNYVATERVFLPGTHHLDPNDPDHPEEARLLVDPWITKHLADGAIEAPARTKERLVAEHQKATENAENAARLLAEADAAMKREEANAAVRRRQDDAVDRELATAANQRGKGA